MGVSAAVRSSEETVNSVGSNVSPARLCSRPGARPAQERVQADGELLDVKRLGDVVVTSRVEPAEAIGQCILGGEEQHG